MGTARPAAEVTRPVIWKFQPTFMFQMKMEMLKQETRQCE